VDYGLNYKISHLLLPLMMMMVVVINLMTVQMICRRRQSGMMELCLAQSVRISIISR